MAEQLICNQQVVGSSPSAGSIYEARIKTDILPGPGRRIAAVLEGGIPERSKGSDCKSDGYAFTGSNPVPPIWLQFETVRKTDCETTSKTGRRRKCGIQKRYGIT